MTDMPAGPGLDALVAEALGATMDALREWRGVSSDDDFAMHALKRWCAQHQLAFQSHRQEYGMPWVSGYDWTTGSNTNRDGIRYWCQILDPDKFVIGVGLAPTLALAICRAIVAAHREVGNAE